MRLCFFIATSKQKDPATITDAAFPKDDGKASAAWTRPLDNPSQLEDEEDNQRWEDYVKGIQSNKSSTETNNASSSNINDAAASWNNYATRLQTSTEIRMNAAIDRFAAERNIDPSRLNSMRPKDREPLRLNRPQRDNYDNNNRRGYSNNNRNSGDKYYNSRNGDHRHQQQYHDDGRRDKHSSRKDKDQSTSSFEEHPLNPELWPSLGGGQSKTNSSDKTTMTEQKVSLGNNGEDNSKISKKKNSNKDKIIDEEKNAPGKEEEQKLLKKDNNDDEAEKQKQDKNGTILTEENPDELSGKGKEKHNSDYNDYNKCIDDKEDESEPLSVQQEDKESGVSKRSLLLRKMT